MKNETGKKTRFSIVFTGNTTVKNRVIRRFKNLKKRKELQENRDMNNTAFLELLLDTYKITVEE